MTNSSNSPNPLLAVLWPPLAPIGPHGLSGRERAWWLTLSTLLVIPATAIWHHAVFYRPTCMLNDFGPDYTLDVVAHWLARDPSLPWGLVASIAIYRLGLSLRWVRVLAAPVFLAFLPLSLWVWDIPFTGRFVCHHFHDKQPLPLIGVALRGRQLYLLGATLYTMLLALVLWRPTAGSGN